MVPTLYHLLHPCTINLPSSLFHSVYIQPSPDLVSFFPQTSYHPLHPSTINVLSIIAYSFQHPFCHHSMCHHNLCNFLSSLPHVCHDPDHMTRSRVHFTCIYTYMAGGTSPSARI